MVPDHLGTLHAVCTFVLTGVIITKYFLRCGITLPNVMSNFEAFDIYCWITFWRNCANWYNTKNGGLCPCFMLLLGTIILKNLCSKWRTKNASFFHLCLFAKIKYRKIFLLEYYKTVIFFAHFLLRYSLFRKLFIQYGY